MDFGGFFAEGDGHAMVVLADFVDGVAVEFFADRLGVALSIVEKSHMGSVLSLDVLFHSI